MSHPESSNGDESVSRQEHSSNTDSSTVGDRKDPENSGGKQSETDTSSQTDLSHQSAEDKDGSEGAGQMSVDNDESVSGDLLLPTVVRASAGTGKTYRLTARLMRILLQGAAPESILATTFTRKAAGEILDRVLLTLAHAADESNPRALEELRKQVKLPTLPPSACLQMFDKLLRNVHRLRICTLDSLFSQLARSFSFELGLPPAWRLTDEIEEAWLREQAVDALIAALDPGEMTALLSMLGKGENRRSIARELLQVVDAAYSGQRQCGVRVWEKLLAPKSPDEKAIADAVIAFRSAQVPQKRLMTRLEKLAQQMETRDFASLA